MWTQRRSGQSNQRGDLDKRAPYERDRTRVIHCPSFRRLQRKTQILGTDEGDFHRTRMTHSLEVASIGCSIVRHLRVNQRPLIDVDLLPDDDLMNVICLLHDIGHPPFGHGGEVALNYKMRCHGGFEGNGQTLRLLTKVETSYGLFGLDLTRRALLGILKYPVPWSKVVRKSSETLAPSSTRVNDWIPPKAYFDSEQPEIDWLLSPFSSEDKTLFQSLASVPDTNKAGRAAYHSFDCSIMDIADNIAYGVHDLEDAIHLRLIHRAHLDTDLFRELLRDAHFSDELLDLLFNKLPHYRKQAIGQLVNYLITSAHVEIANPNFADSLLKYTVNLLPEANKLLDYLMKSVYNHVIDSHESRVFEHGGQTIIVRLFEAISSSPNHLLDNKNRELYQEATNDAAAHRVICDYIANMTDEQASRSHERLFGFNTRKIFQ